MVALLDLLKSSAEVIAFGREDVPAQSAASDDLLQAYLRVVSPGIKFKGLNSEGLDGYSGFVSETTRGKGKLNPSRWHAVFAGVVPQFMPISFSREWDDLDDPFVRPHRVTDFDEATWKLITNEARTLTNTGSALPLVQCWLITALAMGVEDFRSNRFARMAAHYLAQTTPQAEPFIEIGNGDVGDIAYDSMVSVRMFILLRSLVLDVQDKLPSDVLEEIAIWLFQSPHENTNLLKKWSTVAKTVMFALTKDVGANAVRYNASGGNFMKIDTPECVRVEGDDAVFFSFVETKFDEGLKEMRQHGLVALAALYEEMVTAELDDVHRNWATILQFVESSAGFMRTRTRPSIQAALDALEEVDVDADPTITPYLISEYKDFVRQSVEDRNFPSWEEHKAMVVTALTNKSAGRDKVSFQVVIEGNIGSVKLNTVIIDGEEVELLRVRGSDKTSTFWVDPYRYVNQSLVLIGYDGEHVGRIGIRHVPARFTRAIYLIRTEHYLAEFPVGVALMDWQSQRGPNDQRFGSPPCTLR